MSKWGRLAGAIIGFCGSVFGIAQFFGVDWKWVGKNITAHYVFAAISVASMGLFVWAVQGLRARLRVTPENVQAKVRQWLDAFSLGNRLVPSDIWHFAYEVSLLSGVPILLARVRSHPHYLTLLCRVEIAGKHRTAYEKLSPAEKNRVQRQVRLEAAKSKIGYQSDPEWKNLQIEKRIPITKDLTEAKLYDSIDDMNFAALILTETVISQFQR